MNNLLKRNKILVGGGLSLFLTALLVLFFTTSCNNLIQVQDQPQEGKASLVVTVPGHRAASDNIKSYTVDVNGASGNVATAKVEVGGTASFADMAPGEYTVVVQGYDSNGTVIFKGENKATVVAGESTSVVIELKGTSFNVTLYSNLSADDTTSVTQTINYGEKLPAPSSSKGEGYTLAGWTEKQDGSGTVYDANTPVIFTEDKTLYAQWAVTSFTALQGALDAGGTVKVSGNINVTTGLTVSNTVTLVATSGGATLTNETDTTTLSPLFTVNSGTLTLGDGINSLTLDGNAKTAYGVRVASGKVIMKDKVTIQKAANSGVYLSGGKFTMDGGLITGNGDSSKEGGGVYVAGGSFNMTGGEINNNNGSYGGGVYLGRGSFEMSGGIIKKNNATNNGKGVHVNDEQYGSVTFTMSGDALVDSSNDVYLDRYETFVDNVYTEIISSITVGGVLNNTSVATITPSVYPTDVTSVSVLKAKSGVSLEKEVEKFTVTPSSDGKNWEINSSGYLRESTQ